MKNILYLYLLLISSSVCAMQPDKKQNNKPVISRQEIIGGFLVAAPIIHDALIPLYFVPPFTGPMTVLGTIKVGSMALGSAMIIEAQQRRKNQQT